MENGLLPGGSLGKEVRYIMDAWFRDATLSVLKKKVKMQVLINLKSFLIRYNQNYIC